MAKKPDARPNVSKDDLLKYYREMLLIRRFEEKAGQLYGMGLIGGFCHLYIGQEAAGVGGRCIELQGPQRQFLGVGHAGSRLGVASASRSAAGGHNSPHADSS